MTADFRRATHADSPAMLAILRAAALDFAVEGIDQWQGGYPSPALIEADIDAGSAFVLLYDGVLVGTSALCFGRDEDYARIQGGWHADERYAALHRIAVARPWKGTGAAQLLLQNLTRVARQAGMHSIRVDTHRDNRRMQAFLRGQGFAYCGVVHLSAHGNAERVAYDLVLEQAGGPPVGG